MKAFLIVLGVGVVGFAIYWFGIRYKPPAYNGTAVKPNVVAPPTTAGGIVDQTLNTANQAVSIFHQASDLWNANKGFFD